MKATYRRGAVALAAVLALFAIGAASASASQLYVGGKALSGTAAFTPVSKGEGFTIWSTADKFKITCKGMAFEAGYTELKLSSPSSVKGEEFEYEDCTFTEHTNCEIENKKEGPIFIQKLLGTIAKGTGTEDTMTIEYPGGSNFGYFFGTGCALFEGTAVFAYNGSKPSLVLKMPTGQTESVEQSIVFPGEKEKIEYLRQPVYVSGSIKLKLASGQAWSFH
jgi:hypothetical protein